MTTLFKQLHALVVQSDGGLMLSIVAGKVGKMTVAVMPKSNQKDAAESGILTPLALTGSPEELDAEFVRCLSEYADQRKSLVEQLAATTAALDAAKGKATGKGKAVSADKATAALAAPAAQAGVTSAADLIGADDDGSDDESVPGDAIAPAQPQQQVSGSTGSLFGNAALVG
jgi:PRTRC genetic system protein E